jgi:hypothetical protein
MCAAPTPTAIRCAYLPPSMPVLRCLRSCGRSIVCTYCAAKRNPKLSRAVTHGSTALLSSSSSERPARLWRQLLPGFRCCQCQSTWPLLCCNMVHCVAQWVVRDLREMATINRFPMLTMPLHESWLIRCGTPHPLRCTNTHCVAAPNVPMRLAASLCALSVHLCAVPYPADRSRSAL